jgi:DNA-binding NtrC family response regulator
MRHVLVVDDVPAICDIVKLALESDGACRVSMASSAFDAVAAIARDRPHGALIDAALPDLSGVVVANHALSLGVPVLMMTGDLQAQETFRDNGIPFVAKPFHIREVITQTSLLLREARERHAQLTLQMNRLIGNIAELREIVEQSRALKARSEALRRHLKRN